MRKLLQKWFSARRRGADGWFACPLCGEPVRVGALACRACGSDRQTGWASDADSASVDLGPAGEEFDYEGWLRQELEGVGGGSPWARLKIRRVWGWIVVTLLAIALLFGGFGHAFGSRVV